LGAVTLALALVLIVGLESVVNRARECWGECVRAVGFKIPFPIGLGDSGPDPLVCKVGLELGTLVENDVRHVPEARDVCEPVGAMNHIRRGLAVVVPWNAVPLCDCRTLVAVLSTTREVDALVVVVV
jgi:hypothetical protein